MVHPAGDVGETVWTMPQTIHGGHVGQQGLRCTNIGSCSCPTDVLLPGLHRHSVRDVTRCVTTHADHAARHLESVFVGRSKEGCMWAAVAHRHAEALRTAEHHVSTHLASCLVHGR